MTKLKKATYRGDRLLQTKSALYKGYIEVRCPHCGMVRRVEPDGYYAVECEGCGKEYRSIGVV